MKDGIYKSRALSPDKRQMWRGCPKRLILLNYELWGRTVGIDRRVMEELLI